MDPSRTLVAFLLETDPSVATVHLIGSWDNFSSSYPMDRDARRGRGHWRGCHSLQDHVCDGAGTRYRKHTGLAMGHTYYYYYELNGSTEICNPAMPSTTSCPYLPGQKVNTLYIPQEATSRSRRASLTSLSQEHFRTMDPRSKFLTPQPAAPSHSDLSIRRTGTAPAALYTDSALSRDRPSSDASPIKSPWRRFFNKTLISRSLESHDRSTSLHEHRGLTSTSPNYDIRPQTRSEESRTRDISPTSLRRLLVEESDASTRPVSRGSLGPSSHPRTPTLDLLDQLDEEDDDNFVGAADGFSLYPAEEPFFTTRLSPPPFRRDTSPTMARSSSAQTVVPAPRSRQSSLQTSECTLAGLVISPAPQQPLTQLLMLESLSLSVQETFAPSACPSSTLSSAMNSPASPTSGGFPRLCEMPTSGDFSSFYDDSQDDDDTDKYSSLSSHESVPAAHGTAGIGKHVTAPSRTSFSRYRLPPLAFSADKLPVADDTNTISPSPRFATLNSPLLLPRAGESGGGNEGSNLLGPNFLGSSLVGLDDFGHELSWIADSITGRRQS